MSGGAGQGRKRVSFVDPATFTPYFSWKKASRTAADRKKKGAAVLRHVRCEEIPLEDIARQVGTPTYVYSHAAIGNAFRELAAGLGPQPHTLCFAVKSNGNLAILKHLA